MSSRCIVLGVALVLAAVAVPGMSLAVEYQLDLSCITWNSFPDAIIGEAQIIMTVGRTGNGPDDVVYVRFDNIGTDPCSITRVYFDGPGIKSLEPDDDVGGVSFTAPAKSPKNLPGGNPVGFSADASAGSLPPTQPNGINPGESLTIVLNAAKGVGVLQLYEDLVYGNILVGIHVQGFADGDSESFIARPDGSPPS